MRFFTAAFYYAVIIPLSLLPMFVLYRISDFLFAVLFYLTPYRKPVVLRNLRLSFPEKSDAEIRTISRAYYRHLCDLIVESLKAFTISRAEILRRMKLLPSPALENYLANGHSVIAAGGHYNNWEWFGVAIAPQVSKPTVAIYKPLSNRFLDEKAKASRGKYGLRMIPMREAPLLFTDAATVPTMSCFAVDQSPGNPAKAHWMKFLNQETAVMFGAEKFAKEYNLPVVFGVIRKLRRGYYTMEFHDITDRPRDYPHGTIMEEITRRIELEIRARPEFWLWSHRRWKHRRPADALSARL